MSDPHGPLDPLELDAADRHLRECVRDGLDIKVTQIDFARLLTMARGTLEPIPMVLFCPACGTQHIDTPVTAGEEYDARHDHTGGGLVWTTPPHRSHLCALCGHIWRSADVPTVGVKAIMSTGKNDSPIINQDTVRRWRDSRPNPQQLPKDDAFAKSVAAVWAHHVLEGTATGEERRQLADFLGVRLP